MVDVTVIVVAAGELRLAQDLFKFTGPSPLKQGRRSVALVRYAKGRKAGHNCTRSRIRFSGLDR